MSGAMKTISPNIGTGSFVDVRDVAYMHVWAYENPSKADGERYISFGGFGPVQATADVLRQKYKGTKIAENIILGNPGEGYVGYDKETGEVKAVEYPPGNIRASGKKAETEMGLKFIPFIQSLGETADVLEALL
jgi:nucleoside-diphosphate-sugar epimerase